MGIKHYSDLIEAQSHLKKHARITEVIQSELKRLDFFHAQVAQRTARQAELERMRDEGRKEAQLFEKELAQLDQRLNQARLAETGATTNQALEAAQKQQATFTLERDQLENRLFSLLESEEEYNRELEEIQGFLSGADQTLKEIKTEVDTTTAPLEKEQLLLNERIDNLLSLCPKDLVIVFQAARKKHPTTPLTTIEQRRCSHCKMQLESSICESLERGDQYLDCPSCQRLLLPPSVRS
jgi:uncharacterized protein